VTGISGAAWAVTGLNTGSTVESTAVIETLTATFGEDNEFGGFGGCNELSGAFARTGPSSGMIEDVRTTTATATLKDSSGTTQITIRRATS
jgi:hypothetical protein